MKHLQVVEESQNLEDTIWYFEDTVWLFNGIS